MSVLSRGGVMWCDIYERQPPKRYEGKFCIECGMMRAAHDIDHCGVCFECGNRARYERLCRRVDELLNGMG